MGNALVSIQIIPKTKNGEDVIPYVDEAIAIIEKSGVRYEVHPLETTMEGNLSQLFKVIEQMNERMIEIGSKNVISQIKVLYQPDGIEMNDLTEKYRG
ncbi:thiamine-binding protein [Rossellomorea sp. SC111]|uniref:thiamine-binding protein n=1 Tax=Rossellomorea sp. SC111 TaxID=2968985 RepID=UPI00215A7784|nr:thiamine-binding protein [Rossellomorea sp. SC111]MCR8849551.1 thiamine-binding protein [Rossellomorea sp. SC111]